MTPVYDLEELAIRPAASLSANGIEADRMMRESGTLV